MHREHDPRTGRPLVDGRDRLEALTDRELEQELTIAAAEPRHRADRLDARSTNRRDAGAPRAPQPV